MQIADTPQYACIEPHNFQTHILSGHRLLEHLDPIPAANHICVVNQR
jgi:hypothetical protein